MLIIHLRQYALSYKVQAVLSVTLCMHVKCNPLNPRRSWDLMSLWR